MDPRRHVCSIVPRYLLEKLCECDDEEVRHSAQATLSVVQALYTNRHDIFELKCGSAHGSGHQHPHAQPQGIVPGTLLQAVVDSPDADAESKAAARGNLAFSEQVREDRAAALAAAAGVGPAVQPAKEKTVRGSRDTATGFMRSVYDMQNGGDVEDPSSFDLLPGKEARMEGAKATGDEEVDEAYDMALHVLQFYKRFFNYDSLDGKAMEVKSSVHFGRKLGNAFWLGGLEQMVYGDGNSFLHNFTGCIDVIGHEMTVSIDCPWLGRLRIREPGAVYRSDADSTPTPARRDTVQRRPDLPRRVGCPERAHCGRVRHHGQADVRERNGGRGRLAHRRGLSPAGRQGRRAAEHEEPRHRIQRSSIRKFLRSMTCNHALRRLTLINNNQGVDLQPSHMDQIPELMEKHGDFIRERDYGGVHVFSGIPNRAFHLAAVAFGGYTWEKVGRIWWKVVSERAIPPSCTFIQFADATVDAAVALFGKEEACIVRDAWNQVGVKREI